MEILSNPFALIVLAALLLQFGLDRVSELLNLRSLNAALPREFADVFDGERYAQSQRYTAAKTRFGIVTSTASLAILLIFWFLGGFGWLDDRVRMLHQGPILSGLVYFGVLIFAQTLLHLPFRIYGTFVLEERFGFNRTTPKTFVADLIRALVLATLLGTPIVAGILFFFERTGSWAWVYCWGATTAFALIMQYVAPTWIMPLFNKFTPLDDVELREAIFDFARKVRFSVENVFVIDGSRRSAKGNAFFTGFGRTKRIALYDTLIDKQDRGEIVAVLAHEIGHYQRHHVRTGLVLSILQMGVLFYVMRFFLDDPRLFAAFKVEQVSVYVGLLLFALLYTPLDSLMSLAMLWLSRKHEYQADAYAAEHLDQPRLLASALKKLAADNLSNLTPHPFYVVLNYSHPPVLDRIAAIGAAADSKR